MNEYKIMVETVARQHLAEVKAEQERMAKTIEYQQGAQKIERKSAVLSLISALSSSR